MRKVVPKLLSHTVCSFSRELTFRLRWECPVCGHRVKPDRDVKASDVSMTSRWGPLEFVSSFFEENAAWCSCGNARCRVGSAYQRRYRLRFERKP